MIDFKNLRSLGSTTASLGWSVRFSASRRGVSEMSAMTVREGRVKRDQTLDELVTCAQASSHGQSHHTHCCVRKVNVTCRILG